MLSITVTQSAEGVIQQAVADNEALSQPMIRVGVDIENGYAHTLDLTDEVRPSDRKLTSGSIKVLVDPKAWLYLQGTTINFSEEAGGFVFDPPSVMG